MPFAALSRNRAFLLLLVLLVQVGLAPSLQAGCATPDDAPMPCCAGGSSPVGMAEEMGCHEGVPAAPKPADEDPGCPCKVEPAPAPVPPSLGGPRQDPDPIVAVPPGQGGEGLRLGVEWIREHPIPPRVGLGPPIYRLHCTLLI